MDPNTLKTILESLRCLISKLRCVADNENDCKALNKTYAGLVEITNFNKQERVCNQLFDALKPVYESHREDIINKDFAFMEKGMLIFGGYDIGNLYNNVIDSGTEENKLRVTNELLFLFNLQAPSEDQKIISEKHKKKKEVNKQAPSNKKKNKHQPYDMMGSIQGLLEKNKNKFKYAENNPNAVNDVMKTLFTESGGDLADIVQGILGGVQNK